VRNRFPKLRHVFADRVYRGKQLVNALSHCGPWSIEIVQRRRESKASSSCLGGGSLNAPSPGSEDADASPETSKGPPQLKSPGSS
jgi:hypothetical protein